MPSGFTAHPKVDPVTGEMHGFAYWFAEPYLVYYVIDASGALVRSEPITIPRSVMMHDFAISREHVLFFDLPVVFDLEVQPFPFRWDDDTPARVGVMPRGGGDADVQWIDIDPCYVFHPMNAYDDDGSVVVDVPKYETMMKHSRVGPNDGVAPGARAVDDRPRRREGAHRAASTSAARSSRVSTRRCSAPVTATATRSSSSTPATRSTARAI